MALTFLPQLFSEVVAEQRVVCSAQPAVGVRQSSELADGDVGGTESRVHVGAPEKLLGHPESLRFGKQHPVRDEKEHVTLSVLFLLYHSTRIFQPSDQSQARIQGGATIRTSKLSFWFHGWSKACIALSQPEIKSKYSSKF